MTTKNKITIAAILLIVTMNPWSVGYVGQGIDIAVRYFTLYSVYGFVLGLATLLAISLWNMYENRQQVNIPAKSKKTTKAGKYTATPAK